MIDLDALERLAAEALKRPATGEGHIACAMSVCTQIPAALAELRTARELLREALPKLHEWFHRDLAARIRAALAEAKP